MIAEPLTIPLSAHQRARFATWAADLERARQQIQTAQLVAIEMLVAAHLDPVEVVGAAYAITEAGLVITPPPPAPMRLEA